MFTSVLIRISIHTHAYIYIHIYYSIIFSLFFFFVFYFIFRPFDSFILIAYISLHCTAAPQREMKYDFATLPSDHPVIKTHTNALATYRKFLARRPRTRGVRNHRSAFTAFVGNEHPRCATDGRAIKQFAIRCLLSRVPVFVYNNHGCVWTCFSDLSEKTSWNPCWRIQQRVGGGVITS